MRYILLGEVLGPNGNYITKVLGINYFEQPEDKILRKYVKEILAFHANKIQIKEIMSKINNSKDNFRVESNELSYTIIKANPGYLYGTYKNVLARIWVQPTAEDITPKQFTELQNIPAS